MQPYLFQAIQPAHRTLHGCGERTRVTKCFQSQTEVQQGEMSTEVRLSPES